MTIVSAAHIRNHWAIERLNLAGRQFAYGLLQHHVASGVLGTGVTPNEVSILIPLGKNENFAESEDLKVSVRRTWVDWGSGEVEHLQLACHDETLEVVFAQLCSELIDAISQSSTPGQDARVHYDRWRALFAHRRRSGLGRSEIIGLFGELQTLADVVVQRPARDISPWTGPAQAEHDFQNGDKFLEVKSTTSRNQLILEIHGIGQLDVPSGSDLHLVVHRLTESENGFTIDDQIERLIELGVDRIALYDKLSMVGYDWADTTDYASLRFRLDETHWYEVDESFPRIVHASFANGSVPSGVMRLVYSIDLSSGTPQPLDAASVMEVLSGFGGSI